MSALNLIGVEWDDAACQTARAAGHPRLQADVSKLDPLAFAEYDVVDLFAGPGGWDAGLGMLTLAPWRGHLQMCSPPCQGFSTAGKGKGRADVPLVLAAVAWVAQGADIRVVLHNLRKRCSDPRTALVLEPLRWALALRPTVIAWEQVPGVLPLWEACAEVLRAHGYSVWTGNLQAEQYGVPQTRKRAILMARLDGDVAPPVPTHSRYYSRTPDKLDAGVLPWVSMAQALGWGPDGPALTKVQGAGMVERHGASRPRGASEPAFTITGAQGGGSERLRWAYRNGNQPNSARRPLDAPAPTVHFAARQRAVDWVYQAGPQPNDARRRLDEPAPTIRCSRPGNITWVHERPATTVQGDPRIPAPGHRCMTDDCHPSREPESMMARAVRVSVAEASVLQSFPAGYPWQGSKTAQYRQVGDAVPPLFAAHVLAALGVGEVPRT